MGLFDFFIKDVETKDRHPKQEMRTHYYKVEYREAKEAILSYLSKKKIQVTNVNDNYGEILIEQPSYDIIISIKKVTVLEMAIDFKVTTKGLFGANRPFKLVNEWYQYLDKELRFVGVGLKG
jgi:hypothetical protein